MVREVFGKVKEKAENAVHKIEESCAAPVQSVSHAVTEFRPSSLKDMTQRKIAESVHDFGEALPLFEEAGLHLQNFDVDVGLSPKIIPRFLINRIPTQEEQEQIMAKANGKRMIQSILSSLFKAVALQGYLRVGNMKILGLEVHAAAMPTVRLLFGEKPFHSAPADPVLCSQLVP